VQQLEPGEQIFRMLGRLACALKPLDRLPLLIDLLLHARDLFFYPCQAFFKGGAIHAARHNTKEAQTAIIGAFTQTAQRSQSGMIEDSFKVRVMTPSDRELAAEWAAREGWNPGLADSASFTSADAGGFLIGELDGTPAATISVVNYDSGFAFLGFYIVRPDLRGRGYGWRLWQAGMAHAAARTVGLDGVLAQQENYRKSGFMLAYRNVRFGGEMAAPVSPATVALASVPFAAVEEDDATVFPAARASFLRAWISAPGHIGRALLNEGRLRAWGVIRPCRKGCKIGPLVADDVEGAKRIATALIAAVGGGEIFLDVPEPNGQAVALARALGLAPVFETARMYTGPIRAIRLERVFGITTFELG
jgi:ribosomal protein S18 acetylase RimI-like enzyme